MLVDKFYRQLDFLEWPNQARIVALGRSIQTSSPLLVVCVLFQAKWLLDFGKLIAGGLSVLLTPRREKVCW